MSLILRASNWAFSLFSSSLLLQRDQFLRFVGAAFHEVLGEVDGLGAVELALFGGVA